MKRSTRVLLAMGCVLAFACEEGPVSPRQGTITVAVYDGGDPGSPVPDVDIVITPVDLHRTTGDNGLATFHVDPGGYYVDAGVCCNGGGTIDYHVPVTVKAGETSEVPLDACLSCFFDLPQ
ncbi:MAG TPA: hypothetical protein VFD07_02345 [Candidatus Krumholzibacteria bacterium]|nr:hypothetical protein [Candidatus Krumholzibacteria bacterium]